MRTFVVFLSVALFLSTAGWIHAEDPKPASKTKEEKKPEYVPKCKDADYLRIINFYLGNLPVLRTEIDRLKAEITKAEEAGESAGTAEIADMPMDLFLIPTKDLSPRAFWKAWYAQASAHTEHFKKLDQPSLRQALSAVEGKLNMTVYAIREADSQCLKYEAANRSAGYHPSDTAAHTVLAASDRNHSSVATTP